MTRGDGPIDIEHPEPGSALRRTLLASERTYLAWWRSGLAALALAIAVGELVPRVSDGPEWPFVVLGVGFGALGVGALLAGEYRRREVLAAIEEGRYAPLGEHLALVLSGLAVLLGVAAIVLIVAV